MIYAFGDFELDTDAVELRAGGSPRHVEPQVFDLLVHLVRNRDRLVTRDELLEAVWGHRFVADATLGSRVKAARRAIGDSGDAQRLIRTVRGRGLRFVGEVQERDGRPAAVAAPAGRDGDLLVGRADELRVLRGALTAALAGRRGAVLVTGEAGAGKTALVEAFLAEAAATPGVMTLLGAGMEQRADAEPYLAFLDALGGLAASRDAAGILERCAPTWAAALPGMTSAPAPAGATPGRMLRELMAALEALAAERAVLLVLEDLHWADPSTLEAVAALARRRGDARLLVLGTLRPGGPAAALAAELAGRSQATAVRLGGLGPDAVRELVEARIGPGPSAAEAAEALHRRTGGLALFVRSLLDAGDAAGEVPGDLADLLAAEHERLPGEDRRLLERAAVAGPAASAALIAPGVPIAEAEERCARLAADGRALRADGEEAWPDGTVATRYAFAHELHREVLLARMPAGRRAALHREVGDRLRAAWSGREEELAAVLAHHAIGARDAARAVEHLLDAAARALRLAAPREAVGALRAALPLARSLTPDRADAAELAVQRRLAPALVATRGWGSAEAAGAYRRGLELAAGRDPEAEAELLYGLATLHEYRGDYARSAELMQRRLTLGAGADPDRLVESHELLSCSLFHQGAFREALRHARDGIACGGRSDTASSLGEDPSASCHGWAALVHRHLGEHGEALRHAERALEVAERRGYGHAAALLQVARVHADAGDAGEALRHAEDALREAREGGFPYVAAAAAVLRGWARARSGDADGAAEAAAGLEAHEATGAAMDRPYYAGLVADALACAGEPAAALAAADRAIASLAPGRPFFFEPDLRHLRGTLRRAAGDDAGADEDLCRADEVAAALGARPPGRRAPGPVG